MRGETARGLSAGWGAALLQRLGLTQSEQEMVWERRKSSSLFLPLKGLLRSWSRALLQQCTEKGRWETVSIRWNKNSPTRTDRQWSKLPKAADKSPALEFPGCKWTNPWATWSSPIANPVLSRMWDKTRPKAHCKLNDPDRNDCDNRVLQKSFYCVQNVSLT